MRQGAVPGRAHHRELVRRRQQSLRASGRHSAGELTGAGKARFPVIAWCARESARARSWTGLAARGRPTAAADLRGHVLDRDDESRPLGRRGRPTRGARRTPWPRHDRVPRLPQVRHRTRREVHSHPVDVTPRPALPGLIRGDHGVRGRTRVAGGVPARGAVATPYVATRQAQTQVNPRRPGRQALLAACGRTRRNRLDPRGMFAGHAFPWSLASVARECGVELTFDASDRLIQPCQRLPERVPHVDQLVFDVVLADGPCRPARVGRVADIPGRPRGQVRRHARPVHVASDPA
jgi:hypothetical protein